MCTVQELLHSAMQARLAAQPQPPCLAVLEALIAGAGAATIAAMREAAAECAASLQAAVKSDRQCRLGMACGQQELAANSAASQQVKWGEAMVQLDAAALTYVVQELACLAERSLADWGERG